MAMGASAVPSKVCAGCGGRYPADALFCPTDGSPLQSAAAAEREASDPYEGQELAGHIEIRKLVGVGAMGRVYRAFQRGIDRDVAVKILHRELSANPQLVGRFTREAKVASRLQHPNVVQVLLTGQLQDRALYMVMEYLDGLSLQSALAATGGALPLARALHVVLQLCDAVGEAHAQGIVHRDLKPENVMLVRRGADPDFAKVLDFGIARINWGEPSSATAAGLIFGTARYISPEGAQGNVVGPPGDVYSIGTLLYQMLSGRTPFDGEQAVALLVQQIHDTAPDLRSIPRAAYVPEPIADVVMASLGKDPTRRAPDARALGQAIVDAAKLAGLSMNELSRPLVGARPPAAMQLPPTTRTKQLELTPELSARLAPSPTPAAPRTAIEQRPSADTVKWEPPDDLHARIDDASARTRASSMPDATASAPEPRPRLASRVEQTIDDMIAEPELVARPGAAPSSPRTMPGDPEAPRAMQVTPAPAPALHPELVAGPAAPARPPVEGRSRGWLLVVACFALGAAVAFGWAWRAGRIGGGGEEERFVARATDAMFKKHFGEPPGENVKDITDEGLRRWPKDRKLVDVRVRSANELTSQSVTLRAAGDLHEALRLARLAHELDPLDASTKRLLEQYEAELGSADAAAAPPLPTPDPPVQKAATMKGAARASTRTAAPPSASASASSSASPPAPERKAVLDVSVATPRLGQTVDFVARVSPDRDEPVDASFVVVGPGVPGGVRMPAQSTSPGVFKASYAFLEPGRFEVVFSARGGDRPITARHSVTAGAAGPTPAPSPSGNVKWM